MVVFAGGPRKSSLGSIFFLKSWIQSFISIPQSVTWYHWISRSPQSALFLPAPREEMAVCYIFQSLVDGLVDADYKLNMAQRLSPLETQILQNWANNLSESGCSFPLGVLMGKDPGNTSQWYHGDITTTLSGGEVKWLHGAGSQADSDSVLDSRVTTH